MERREQPVSCSGKEEITFELNLVEKINWGWGGEGIPSKGINMYKKKY